MTCASPRKASTPSRSPPCSISTLTSGPPSRGLVFVGTRTAKQLLALQVGALRGIEIAQEQYRVGVGYGLPPVDLAADSVAYVAQQRRCLGGVGAAQDLFQHLQLERAIRQQLPVRESKASGALDKIA